MAEQPTKFSELNVVLFELVRSTEAILKDNFVAAYLQGSFGMGDADADSDVDFTIVVNRDLNETELSALQAMHARIYEMATDWARHLEGSYFPQELIKREDPALTPLWYLDNTERELVRSTHDNSLVVRWVTRERGITLAGPPPTALIDPVHPDDLRREMRAVMRDWGKEILEGSYTIGNRWAQPFAVISYCRMLQTLETGTIESKPAGVRWALAKLDPHWAGLIQRAWAARPNPSLKVRQEADPGDVAQTKEFILYAIGLSKEA
jgi:predicted nucleotidyltransferase